MAARLNLLNAILTFGSLLLHGTVANYALKKDWYSSSLSS